jgi:hypothetical protein
MKSSVPAEAYRGSIVRHIPLTEIITDSLEQLLTVAERTRNTALVVREGTGELLESALAPYELFLLAVQGSDLVYRAGLEHMSCALITTARHFVNDAELEHLGAELRRHSRSLGALYEAPIQKLSEEEIATIQEKMQKVKESAVTLKGTYQS